MTCPRCGLADVGDPTCPRCGVVFAKLGAARPRPPARLPAPAEPPARSPSGYGTLVLPAVLGIATLGTLVWWQLRPTSGAGANPIAAPPSRSRTTRPARTAEPAPTVPMVTIPLPAPTLDAGQAPDADVAAANDLVNRLNGGGLIGPADVRLAEELAARHPAEPRLRELLGAVLMTAGHQAASRRQHAEAASRYERAAEVLATHTAPRLALLDLLLSTSDWPGAEAAARAALGLDPTRVEALYGLAFALFRQDRNREAVDALKTSLSVRETPEARALLERIQKGLADESGMTEQRISHFNVRYDGAAHEDVGREILRGLERHYATLVVSLDHRPQVTIPVILFSQQQYYDASGAPAWSGGVYDGVDGRIRIPIGGLTASLTSDMDGTLIHEVTHAFIADRSRGRAPREVHEGLAQYMEGKRLAAMLDADQLRALADGRGQGVYAFYLQALAFVEYLIAQRGPGGMNDLLRVMGETEDVNEAFRRIYGQDYAATRRAWRQRLQQQYGS